MEPTAREAGTSAPQGGERQRAKRSLPTGPVSTIGQYLITYEGSEVMTYKLATAGRALADCAQLGLDRLKKGAREEQLGNGVIHSWPWGEPARAL